KHDPLYRIRRVLRRGADNLSPRAWERLLAGLEAGDVDQQIARWATAPPPKSPTPTSKTTHSPPETAQSAVR
ncbi:MAG: hypothetical protein M3Q27_02380, partial [Actinomycetota bacterium]|nr:hypothetical protein [Actinomycetota bacterium]